MRGSCSSLTAKDAALGCARTWRVVDRPQRTRVQLLARITMIVRRCVGGNRTVIDAPRSLFPSAFCLCRPQIVRRKRCDEYWVPVGLQVMSSPTPNQVAGFPAWSSALLVAVKQG